VYGIGGFKGVYGVSTQPGSFGVWGDGIYTGVYGHGGTGSGVYGNGGLFGVYATGNNLNSVGVYGNGVSVGVQGFGSYDYGGEAGYFKDSSHTGTASLGVGDTGVIGNGTFMGGKFLQGNASGVEADLCYNATAVVGYAHNPGENPAWFQDYSAGSFAAVGKGGYKINGNGSVSFVQNDPTDPARQIVYTAPEGDEVAVYTRGEAKLLNGEARVALGKTFGWVANPDLGLTANVTARGPAVLYVASVTPQELVVRSDDPAGAGAVFDYMVWGLRIGFEERPVVQPKEHESPIPNLSQDAAILSAHPELKTFTASSRHAAMRRVVEPSLPATPDLSRAAALKTSIGVYDPARDAPVHDPNRVTVADPATLPMRSPTTPGTPTRPVPPRDYGAIPAEPAGQPAPLTPGGAPPPAATQAPVPTWPVSEPVEAGDLLTLDPAHPGELLRATTPSDPNVVGIAASDSTDAGGPFRVPLVDTFYPRVKADATVVAIHAGDLLVSSAMPGYVMRAPEGSPLASIVGKAMEGLEAGTGKITISRMGR
jgi:hypothetical protein